MTTLYVSDLDGTLLGPDAKISPQSAAMLNRAFSLGAEVTVASARTHATVVPLLAGIETAAPAVVMTGAALWNRQYAKLQNINFIPPDELKLLLQVFERHNLNPFVYFLSEPDAQWPVLEVYSFSSDFNEAQKKFYDERKQLKLKRFHPGKKIPETLFDRCVLIFVIDDETRADSAAGELHGSSACAISHYPDTYTAGMGIVEVFAPGVSKARAVERLKVSTGASRLVVFGDNLNDIPMMQLADESIAVLNARPEVLLKADKIIGPNTSNAVPKAILEDFFNEK